MRRSRRVFVLGGFAAADNGTAVCVENNVAGAEINLGETVQVCFLYSFFVTRRVFFSMTLNGINNGLWCCRGRRAIFCSIA